MDFNKINKKIHIIKKYKSKNKISENDFKNALQYLKSLNFNTYEDKLNFIYLLIDTILNYKNYDLFKELIINNYHFENIFNIFNFSNYEIEYIKYNDYCFNTFKYNKIFNINNSIIYDEINKINNINTKYKMSDINLINITINSYYIYEIKIDKKIKYDINTCYNMLINLFNDRLYTTKSFIINDNNFNKHQEYFKSAIIFLLNNETFMNELEKETYNLNCLSNNSNNFPKNFNIKEFIQDKQKLIYYLKTNNFIEIRNILNNHLNNKYSLNIPSFNLYSFYIIQDILFLLNNQFTYNCFLRYKYFYSDEIDYYELNKVFSCIIDCKDDYYMYYENPDIKNNCFLNDLMLKYSKKIFDFKYLNYNYLQSLPEEYEKEMSKYNDKERLLIEDDEYFQQPYYIKSEIFRRNFKIINNKYFYEKNIISYVKYIDIYPKHLLINSSIDDVNAIFMYNNREDLRFYSFNQLILLSNYIRHKYEINIIFPFKLNLKNHKYKLHSFIMIKNISDYNLKFINYKIKYNKELISLIRITDERLVLNKYNIKNYNKELQKEFNTIYNKNYLKDCLQYKIIFCCYEMI